MLWHRQEIFKSKGDELSFSAECRIWTRVFGTESPADWMPADKPTELSRIKLKTWTQQVVPMISKHSAHSTPLPFGFRTWLWWYTCLLLLISMLWHRQEIFKSKGDELSFFAECRIWTRVFGTESPADWMLADKPTELSRIKLKTWTQQLVPMISEHSAHWMQDLNQGLWNQISSRLNARWQTDWVARLRCQKAIYKIIEIQENFA